MLPTTSQPGLQQEILDKLNRALDLVLKTAEAASAQHNHKVVIQSAREVTRIVTLITKMTNPKTRPATRSGQSGWESQEPVAKKNQAGKKTGGAEPKPEDCLLPDLETFFPAHKLASLDNDNRELFHNISRDYQKLSAIGGELAVRLDKSAPRNGRGK